MSLTKSQADKLDETHSAIKTLEAFVKVNYKAIHGNGQPGLLKDVEELKTMHKQEKNNTTMYIAVGSMLASFGLLLWTIFN